jgi:phospholipase C
MSTERLKRVVCAGAAVSMMAGCGALQPGSHGSSAFGAPTVAMSLPKSNKIKHVVVIVQENRTTDNLFNGFPGADTVTSGQNSKGQTVELLPEPLTADYDVKHSHRTFLVEYNHGKMNGFDRAKTYCRRASECPPPNVRAYAYVPQSGIQPYFDMGEQYTFGDEMFASNQGPSFPAHQYIVSGTSTLYDGATLKASENPGHHRGGCDSPPGTKVPLINAAGKEGHKVFPCFERISIFTLLDGAQISWKYYQANSGARLWNAVDALKPIWQNRTEYAANVIVPSSQVLTDIGDGNLAQVVFVTPTAAESDHSGVNNGTGPDWVASVVNAIGKSPYWNTTAIFVTWDDWGGWYDHTAPTIYNSYELGMRVPFIVISPYARQAYVSHVHHEFGSILKFIEETFGLGSLDTTDARADDLSDCFKFGQRPRRFRVIPTAHSAEYFLRQPIDSAIPDSD